MSTTPRTARKSRPVLSRRLAAAGGLAVAGSAALGLAAAAPADAAPAQHPSAHSAPVFVQTDNVAGNSIVAYDRQADGSLVQAGNYPTGGKGGVLTGSVSDHLASQGSLTYDAANHLLYAVNAGSNTITVFRVDGDTLIREQTITSGGTFPVSVTVHGNLVYVLNARDGGRVQGYLRLHDTLIRIPSWSRALGLDATQTPEFTHTPGQIAFTPDGSKLVVTTKANGNNIVVFGLDIFGGLKPGSVVTPQPGAVPFAISFDATGKLAIAEAGPSAVARFAVQRDGSLTPVDTAATGQAATCWIFSSGDYLYTGNAGGASVSGFAVAPSTLTALGNTSTGPGTVDGTASADGRFAYVQTGIAGNVVALAIGKDGSLTPVGTVTVPGAVGGEGIVAL